MPIDIIFLAVFAYGFWIGYSRGIIGTVFNFAAYIFGVVLAFKITPTTTHVLESLFHSDNPSMFLAAFIVNLVFIMFVLRQAAKGMESAFRAAYLGVLNQTAGGVLMAGFGVVVYSILIWFLVQVRFLNDQTLSESKMYPFLKDLPAKAKAVALRTKPFAEDIWGYSMNWMDRLEQYGVQKTATKPNIYKVPDDGKAIEDDGPQPATTVTPAYPQDSDGIEE
jgi:membrane protein required for colicin V production